MSNISNFFNYHKKLALLATPIILSNIGQVFVSLTDTLMVGQLGKTPLAIVSLSSMIIMVFIVTGQGFANGLTPLVAKKFVLGKKNLCTELLGSSLTLNSTLGVVLSTILLLMIPLLGYMGQPQEVVDNMLGFYTITSLSIIPYIIFLTFKQFLEGIGNTSVSMMISITCNLLNVILNYLFIFGKFGFPEWGVFGAGFATFLSRLSMPIIFIIYFKLSKYKSYKFKLSIKAINSRLIKLIAKFSLPISTQMVVEFLSLTIITILLGTLGESELAANQIAYSMMSIMYLVVLGISAAVTIMVSFENGKHNLEGIKKYVSTGIQLAIVLMGISAILLTCFGVEIASLFSTDKDVIMFAASYMAAVATVQVFDGIQVIYLGALRGIGDVKAPMKYAIFLYGILCTSIAYTFGFILDYKGVGVWLGFAVGLLLASIVYWLRFRTTLKTMFK